MDGLQQQCAARRQGAGDRGEQGLQVLFQQGEVAGHGIEAAEAQGLLDKALVVAALERSPCGPRQLNQPRGRIHAQGGNAPLGQGTAQPALATPQVQHTLRCPRHQRIEHGAVGGQATAFDASPAHGVGPGAGIGAPTAVYLLPIIV
ncbi:hypothetical protein PSm6_04830 [Pseudomonas solani]|uniref:Uncharacterized protein n=1 Tax=Pseudomonas solani TaxID=2731552 RepID=A0ABM7L3D9_9PSED|nr:hypothetical protein PSm6_04830 [Pseudomonas solani]